MEVAAWWRREGRDCGTCGKIRQELHRLPPNCTRCDFPGLWAENLPAWEVIQATGQALVDGMGGINLGNVRQVCEALGREWNAGLVRKVIAVAAEMLQK